MIRVTLSVAALFISSVAFAQGQAGFNPKAVGYPGGSSNVTTILERIVERFGQPNMDFAKPVAGKKVPYRYLVYQPEGVAVVYSQFPKGKSWVFDGFYHQQTGRKLGNAEFLQAMAKRDKVAIARTEKAAEEAKLNTKGPAITRENYERLKVNQRLAEVQEILGPGKEESSDTSFTYMVWRSMPPAGQRPIVIRATFNFSSSQLKTKSISD
jgi:hypothetical protein